MIKQTVTYTDFNGVKQTEDFYFNLSKAELIDMLIDEENVVEELQRLTETNDAKEALKWFRKLVRMSIGRRSEDGKRFHKNAEILADFEETEAYSEFLFSLVSDPSKGGEFINGLLPSDILASAQMEIEKGKFENSSEAIRALSEQKMQGFNKKEEKKSEDKPKIDVSKMSEAELRAALEARVKGENN